MGWGKIDTFFRYRIGPICSTFADRKRQNVKPALVHDGELEVCVGCPPDPPVQGGRHPAQACAFYVPLDVRDDLTGVASYQRRLSPSVATPS